MQRIVFVFLSLLLSFFCFSQKTVQEYKSIFDEFILKELDSAIFSQIKCDSYLAKSADDTTSYAGGYIENSKAVLSNLNWIGFFYDLYSEKLNYQFHFYLTLNTKTGFIGPVSMVRNTFPECIRKNIFCKIISKDSAISIAQKNGIKYPGNVYVDIVKPKGSNEFFWAIDSQDPNFINYNIRLKDSLDYPIMPWKENNTKIINASNGEIIKLRDYWLLDK